MINPSLGYYTEVVEYVKKSFSDFQINYFALGRVYRDGRMYALHSDPRWAKEHLVENKLPPAGLINFDELESKQLKFKSEDYDKKMGWPEGAYLVAKEKFNVKNPLTCLIKHDEYVDQYMIDIHDTNVVDLYLNQLPLIENIFIAIRWHFRDLLADISKNPLVYDNKNCVKKIIKKHRNSPTNNEILLYHNNCFGKVSAREQTCLAGLAKGERVKDIALRLGISPRTVETHINNIKIKLNIHRTKDLIACYWDNKVFM